VSGVNLNIFDCARLFIITHQITCVKEFSVPLNVIRLVWVGGSDQSKISFSSDLLNNLPVLSLLDRFNPFTGRTFIPSLIEAQNFSHGYVKLGLCVC
jgi:hypothetical protein